MTIEMSVVFATADELRLFLKQVEELASSYRAIANPTSDYPRFLERKIARYRKSLDRHEKYLKGRP